MTMAPSIRVLIVDDHRMFAESLARLLSAEDGIEVVATVTTASDGAAAAARHRPDVVLLDQGLPDGDGTAVASDIRRRDAAVNVVMLTGAPDEGVLAAAIEAGCCGFLTKDRAAVEVVAAVRAAARGDAVISPAALARLLPKLRATDRSGASELTAREQQVVALLAQGLSNKEIATELHLSLNTIRNYVQGTLVKLGAHSKLQAVALAVRTGVIDYPS
jgi:DNA-binding NarL/FixJ family response regulator